MTGAAADLAAALGNARRVVALTGAGISTDSGIPDFRGPDGVWTTDPTAEGLTHWPTYRDDEAVRRRSWRWRTSSPALRAEPNDAHRALVRLADDGLLTDVVTQNTDGLHRKAGLSIDQVHELHGSMRDVVCTHCSWRGPMSWAVAQVEAGDDDPRCPGCMSITKAATVFFGESLPRAVLAAALDATEACDLFLVIGTSLTVHPAATLPQLAVEGGADLVVLNAEPTPLDGLATLVLREPIGDVLPSAVARVTDATG